MFKEQQPHNQEKLSTYNKLLEFLKPSPDVLIAHHNDADGLASVAIFIAMHASIHGTSINKIKNHIKNFPIDNGPRNFDAQQMLELQTTPHTNIIFIDLNPRDIKQLSTLIESGHQIANVDHHNLVTQPDEIILVNPAKIAPEEVKNASTSSILLDIAKHHLELQNESWSNLVFLAKIGNLGDIKEAYPIPTEEKEELFKIAQFLNTVGGTIDTQTDYKEEKELLEKLINVLTQSCSVSEFWENLKQYPELKSKFNKIDTSITKDIQSLETKIQSDKSSLIVHYLENPRFGTNEATLKKHLKLLEQQNKNATPVTIMLIFKTKDKYRISLYSTNNKIIDSKNNCGEICINIGTRFGLEGGGHPHRAGADIPIDKINDAIQQVQNSINSTLNL